MLLKQYAATQTSDGNSRKHRATAFGADGAEIRQRIAVYIERVDVTHVHFSRRVALRPSCTCPIRGQRGKEANGSEPGVFRVIHAEQLRRALRVSIVE
jgi:hypothetical protein